MVAYLLFLWIGTMTLAFQPTRMRRHYHVPMIPRKAHKTEQKAFSTLNFPALSEERQQELTEMVARGLVPVFFRGDSMIDANNNLLNTSPSNTAITAEKALKRVLREYQKEVTESKNSNSPDAAEERFQTRKFLSDLLLGTSIMRIRHYHTLVAALNEQENLRQDGADSISPTYGLSLQDLGPINGVDISTSVIRSTKTGPFLMVDDNAKRLELSRAMVHIHLRYLQEQGQDPSTMESLLSDFLSLLKDPVLEISVRSSLPLFFVQLLIDQYGLDLTEQMANTFNAPGPITIRRNVIRCRSDAELQSILLSNHGIRFAPIVPAKWNHRNGTDALNTAYLQLVPDESWSPSKSSIWSLSSWKEGYFEVQDAGSQFIVQSIEPTFDNGKFVAVDYCAGNGGKSLALASHIKQHQKVKNDENCGIGGSATIIAHDIVSDRLKQLEGSLSRTGLQEADSAVQILTTTNLTDFANGQGYPESFADVVLVDAPCSSTGVLRRRPSQRFQLNEDEIRNRFPELQLSILQEASKLVKVGGTLVYATCSICTSENEQVVASFEESSSSNNGDDKLWRPLRFGTKQGQEEHEQPSVKDIRHYCNLLPIRTDSSDGFFVARWTRIE